MKFTALPIHSVEDATLDFDQLEVLLTQPGSQLPFLQLLSAQKLQLAPGEVAVSWPGGNRQTNAVAVNHGIGRIPAAAGAFATNPNSAYAITGATSTQITIQGNTLDGSSPAAGTALNVYWLAIG